MYIYDRKWCRVESSLQINWAHNFYTEEWKKENQVFSFLTIMQLKKSRKEPLSLIFNWVDSPR